MEFTNVLKAIGDYGLPLVCSGILVFLYIKMVLDRNKIINGLFEKFSQKIDKLHPSTEESYHVDRINESIRELLQKIQNKLNSDRTYLFLFHNGGKSLSGLSFQKMSCINEVVGRGIAPCANTSQALYRTNYADIVNSLKTNKQYVVESLKDIEESSPYIYCFFKDRHAESAYLVPVEDSDGYMIGFIGIEYCSINTIKSKEEIIETLITFSNRISSLVDIKQTITE